MSTLVDHVVTTYLPSALAKGITLTAHVDPAVPPWVMADAMRVHQVLGNLVSNAVKYTSLGGVELLVAVQASDSAQQLLQFTVRDSGNGIAPDVLRNLFQPSEQGDAAQARRVGGTGLGLAICRGLAEHMGGRVTLSSIAGEGTSAVLELSLAPVSAPLVGLPQQHGEHSPRLATQEVVLGQPVADAGIASARAVVADDHPTNRFLLVRQLRQIGIACDAAADGEQALALLRRGGYDLLVTDCEMPVMDGFALTRAVRSEPGALARLPVVACTAHALPEVRAQCVSAGVDAVLNKPITIADLREVLRRWPGMVPGAPASETGSVTAAVDQGEGPDAAAVLDRVQLARMVGTGADAAEVERNLIESFGQDQRQTMAMIEAALADGDNETLVRYAHRSKGACLFVGAQALGRAFGALEASARGLETQVQLAQRLAQIVVECGRLERRMPGLVLIDTP